MSELSSYDPLSSLESAGWSRVADSLFRGIRHTLAGRLTSLMGVEELVRSGASSGEVLRALARERTRILEVTLLLDLLAVGESSVDSQPLDTRDLAQRVLSLHGLAARGGVELPGVVGTPDTPPAFWSPALMVRSLLLLLDGLDEVGSVRVEAGEGGRVRLSVAARGVKDPDELGRRLRGVEETLRSEGGGACASAGPEGVTVQLEFPGLPLRRG